MKEDAIEKEMLLEEDFAKNMMCSGETFIASKLASFKPKRDVRYRVDSFVITGFFTMWGTVVT